MSRPMVTVVGAGLAGSEASWQIAKRGVQVTLVEMRPDVMTQAHSTAAFAELVCSNSLGATSPHSAAGMLKYELSLLDSLILKHAYKSSVPAGGALAVDRQEFSQGVTSDLYSHPLVSIEHREVEVTNAEEGYVVIATGPLTSDSLAASIVELTGEDGLYFYDAAAPVLTTDSVDTTKAFWASRYDQGDDAYLNCPMDEETYLAFYGALVAAERAQLHRFEAPHFFEGCMPIEQLADRGIDTIRFGPLKPVGLRYPDSGKQPYAVVQLRRDNRAGTLVNMVGFQTRLKWHEQERVFRMIPGLERAEFVRFGVIHRNTYLNSPHCLMPTYQCRLAPNLFFAGQMTGVEGYMESTASGLVAGINAARMCRGIEPVIFPAETMIGALTGYITGCERKRFEPMNANIGILPPLPHRVKDKRQRNEQMSGRASERISHFINL